MTYLDFKKITELEIVEVTGNTIHLHCKEGYYLTDFQGDDYFNYKDFFCAYLPIKEEYPNFEVIDEVKHKENLAKKMEAFRLKQEEENKKRKELLENANEE